MRKIFQAFSLCVALAYLPKGLAADPSPNLGTIPDKTLLSATLVAPQAALPEISLTSDALIQGLNEADLRARPELTEQLLNAAINANHVAAIEKLLPIYRQLPSADPLLVKFAEAQLAKQQGNYSLAIARYRDILAAQPELTPVRIQLATALFHAQQDNAAREQFDRALADSALPQDIAGLVRVYRQALDNRDGWQFSFGVRYLRERNVNNVSDAQAFQWRGLTFYKGAAMERQKAHGLGYWANLERDFNFTGAHYLHVENLLYGKNYWDNHRYDDITNRTYLGYVYKSALGRVALLPFYERQWYGNVRYKWAQGARLEWNRWLSPNWQLSLAGEMSRSHYHRDEMLNGNDKLASATLLWRRTPQQFFYIGSDFTAERTKVRQYSYDLRAIRLGWGQEWRYGISSRVALLAAKRQYKADFALGALRFNQARKDHIYQANLTLWKRDWHLWGITPKLQFNWKQQLSNFDALYSYTEKSANVLIEKTF